MDDKLKQEVEAMVAAIFSEKEEADMREKTEQALNQSAETIDELTTALEAKNIEVETASTKIGELEEQKTSLEGELEAARTETEEIKNRLEEANKALEDMRKDKAADERMAEIESAGVLRSDKNTQRIKVREMSDEEFASYKEELVSVRATVLAELEAAKEGLSKNTKPEGESATTDNQDGGEDGTEGAEAASDSNDDEVDTPPANIDPGKAIAAAMNMEHRPSDDLLTKYREMGSAMADAFKKNK